MRQPVRSAEKPAPRSHAGWAILTTWLFWATFAVATNPTFFGGLIFPPLLLPLPDFYLRWLDFILIPAALGAVAASIVSMVIQRWDFPVSRLLAVLGANAAFLAVFLAAAEVRSAMLMDGGGQSECFDRTAFVTSLGFAGHEFQTDVHAVRIRGGTVEFWSYSELGWYSVPETIYRNIDVGACQSVLPGRGG